MSQYVIEFGYENSANLSVFCRFNMAIRKGEEWLMNREWDANIKDVTKVSEWVNQVAHKICVFGVYKDGQVVYDNQHSRRDTYPCRYDFDVHQEPMREAANF